MPLPIIGGKKSAHDVPFIGQVVCGLSDSGGSINLKGKGHFDPGDSGIARGGVFDFILGAPLVEDFGARWLPLELVAPLANRVPNVVWGVVPIFVLA